MVDARRLHRHIEFLSRYLADLRRYRDALPAERLRAERDLQYQVLFPLTMAIQSCIDIASHVVAEEGLPRPESSAEVFARLADAGRIDASLAHQLARAVAARNLFVHRYWQIDIDKVVEILRTGLEPLAEFAAWAAGLAGAEDASAPGR